jgi:hypothetical protein
MMATNIPAAATRFPFRADTGLESIFNPTINVTDPNK